MDFSFFLNHLLEHGRVQVAVAAPLSQDDFHKADAVLANFERDWRLELAGEPPEFSLEAARWAATMLYRACQFIVYRNFSEETMRRELSAPPPSNEPASHYSVDLTFRFLPDVMRLAKAASHDDPLIEDLHEWAAQWPLSSVGMAGVEPRDVTPLLRRPALLALYTDRIISRGDISRLDHPDVRSAIESVLGLHTDLAPKVAAELSRSQ